MATVGANPAEHAAPPCNGWNDAHDCHLPTDHPGDHECGGCGDLWNRGAWDDDPEDWEHQRPDEADRCVTIYARDAR